MLNLSLFKTIQRISRLLVYILNIFYYNYISNILSIIRFLTKSLKAFARNLFYLFE
jgi:hypothetical protein